MPYPPVLRHCTPAKKDIQIRSTPAPPHTPFSYGFSSHPSVLCCCAPPFCPSSFCAPPFPGPAFFRPDITAPVHLSQTAFQFSTKEVSHYLKSAGFCRTAPPHHTPEAAGSHTAAFFFSLPDNRHSPGSLLRRDFHCRKPCCLTVHTM